MCSAERRPSRATMSNSCLVAGCTDSRLPFCVTIIDSSPFVFFSVPSGTMHGKRSTNPTSTMYQVGVSASDDGS